MKNEIGASIVDAAIKVHSVLGPGLLESAYEACLVFEPQLSRPSHERWDHSTR